MEISKAEIQFSEPFKQIGEYRDVPIMEIGVTSRGNRVAVVKDCNTSADLPETFDTVSPIMAFRLTRAGW